MLWTDAVAWVNSLVHGGYDDWRLPTTPGTGMGYLHEGEMGHLFLTEQVNAERPVLFNNVQNKDYWTGTEYNQNYAWALHLGTGLQWPRDKLWGYQGIGNYAWAVRDGDVSAPVPEPSTMLLFGPGLIGLVGLRRKYKK